MTDIAEIMQELLEFAGWMNVKNLRFHEQNGARWTGVHLQCGDELWQHIKAECPVSKSLFEEIEYEGAVLKGVYIDQFEMGRQPRVILRWEYEQASDLGYTLALEASTRMCVKQAAQEFVYNKSEDLRINVLRELQYLEEEARKCRHT